jgi:hypothetical protein
MREGWMIEEMHLKGGLSWDELVFVEDHSLVG